jgi:glutamate-1-semialdehyde aminotransferase
MKSYLEMINCPVSSITHVPHDVSENTFEFEYNDIHSLKSIMEKEGQSTACIIMEAIYFEAPRNGFLEEVKKIAHEYGAVLIFDEVKTGVRVSNGGAQEYLNIIPDMSVFSKAISNGFPFSVVVGSKEVMSACEELWFAGTNCGNAVGISAALATIRESKKVNAVKHIWMLGERIMKGINELIGRYEVPAVIGGLQPMPYLSFNASSMQKKKEITELYLSELIKRGVFMPVEHCFYISYNHSIKDIDDTLNTIEEAFKLIK